MKKKILMPILLLSGVLTLSSCALFNDDDMAIHNTYNPATPTPEVDPDAPVAGGVAGKETDAVKDAYVFKNISYASSDNKILNTYKEGGVNYNGYTVNNNQDYYGDEDTTNYDLYVPKDTVTPRNAKHNVILFIHGGAWVSGFKTDVNPYIYEFANRGYITATIKYTLLSRSMDDPTLSIFRNLDEIDACIKSIKSVLTSLGFDTSLSNFVIGGASSGAHLAMLYSYSRGSRCAFPIKFIVDAVGPVDIKPNTWKAFADPVAAIEDGLSASAVASQELTDLAIMGDEDGANWNDYQTMRIANGMCGLPFNLEQVEASSSDKIHIDQPNDASNSMLTKGENLLSVTYWINQITEEEHKYPIICAYAGKDSVVGINQYATLETALDAKGINHTLPDSTKYIYFKNSEHIELTAKYDEVNYNKLINSVVSWCESL